MKVSIIIPVYNGENYLEKCLDTIINQSYKNLEIIVVNDGSTDNTSKILNKYSKKDERIIVIDKENGGQAIARNVAFEKATGDYVCFFDSDDYVDLDLIEKFIDLSKKEDFDIAVCDYNCIYDDGSQIKRSGLENVGDNNSINFMFSLPAPTAKMYKRSFLKKVNFKFLEKRIYEDFAVIPALGIKTKKISHLKNVYYHYIIHSNSTMNQTKFNPKLNDIFYAIENLTKLFGNKYKDELEFLYIKHLLHDASLRFLNFNNKESKKSLNKIVIIMKEKYPNWTKNKYLFLLNKKEYLLTIIIYNKLTFIYNIYRKVIH